MIPFTERFVYTNSYKLFVILYPKLAFLKYVLEQNIISNIN